MWCTVCTTCIRRPIINNLFSPYEWTQSCHYDGVRVCWGVEIKRRTGEKVPACVSVTDCLQFIPHAAPCCNALFCRGVCIRHVTCASTSPSIFGRRLSSLAVFSLRPIARSRRMQLKSRIPRRAARRVHTAGGPHSKQWKRKAGRPAGTRRQKNVIDRTSCIWTAANVSLRPTALKR